MDLEYNNILVGVDGSQEAENALKRAVEIAVRYQATLYIAHVIDIRALSSYASINYNYRNLANEETIKALNEYQSFAADKGVEKVETIIEYGSPRTLMSRSIPEEHNIDLVVVGATGLNAVERVFIGSVSEQITRQAPCDVIIVRNHPENEDEPIVKTIRRPENE